MRYLSCKDDPGDVILGQAPSLNSFQGGETPISAAWKDELIGSIRSIRSLKTLGLYYYVIYLLWRPASSIWEDLVRLLG